MKEVHNEQKQKQIEAVIEECRKKGVTINDLLKHALLDETTEFIDNNANAETLEIERHVSNILKKLGMPAHIKGYRYVRDAIIFAFEHPDTMDKVTKVLYPTIAKHFDTTPSRVERAIRHAIEVAWDRGNSDVLNNYFGYSIKSDRGKPTNSEFIAMIADKLYLEDRR